MKKIALLVLLILVIVIGTIPLAKLEPEELKVIEGKYIIVKIPERYFEEVKTQLPYYDRMYELFYELVGDVPYGGGKVTIEYLPGDPLGAYLYPGNLILIGESIWERLKKGPSTEMFVWKVNAWEVNATVAHELGHDFTLYSPSLARNLIVPEVGFKEGWADFLEYYIADKFGFLEYYSAYKFGVKDTKRIMYLVASQIRDLYGGKNFTSLPYHEGGPRADYVKAVLLFYVYHYDWQALQKFFELARNIKNSEFVNIKYGRFDDALSTFVYFLGLAANDIEGVYKLFEEFGFPVKRLYVVQVKTENLPPSISIQVKVIPKGSWGGDYEKLRAGEKIKYLLKEGSYKAEIYPSVVVRGGVRYLVKEDTIYFTVPCPEDIVFKFSTHYYLDYQQGGKSGWYSEGERIVIAIETEIKELGNQTRLIFEGFLVNGKLLKNSSIHLIVNQPINITEIWKKQYYIGVSSKYGEVRGDGWYTEGSVALVKIQPTEIILRENFLVKELVRLVNWKEEIVVDRPKELVAQWEEKTEIKWENVSVVILLIIIIGGVVAIIKFKFKKI